jgi:hypothetical protein
LILKFLDHYLDLELLLHLLLLLLEKLFQLLMLKKIHQEMKYDNLLLHLRHLFHLHLHHHQLQLNSLH